MPYQDRHLDTVLPWDYATDENEAADPASTHRAGNRRTVVAVAAFVLVAALVATLLAALQAG